MGAFFSIFGSRNRSAIPNLQTTLTQNSPLKSPYTGYVSTPNLQSTLSQSITGIKPSMASMLNSPDVIIPRPTLQPSAPSVGDFASPISQSTLAPSNQVIRRSTPSMFLSTFTPRVIIDPKTGKTTTSRMPTVPPRATHFASVLG
jgi:hypothetical protein